MGFWETKSPTWMMAEAVIFSFNWMVGPKLKPSRHQPQNLFSLLVRINVINFVQSFFGHSFFLKEFNHTHIHIHHVALDIYIHR